MTDKEAMQAAYLEGYRAGHNVEELSDVALRAATTSFERWYALNYQQETEGKKWTVPE